MEELVRRFSGGTERVSLVAFVEWPEREPAFSYAEEMKKKVFSEGTAGAVQSFFFRAEDGPWTEDRLAGLATVDVVIHLSRGSPRPRSTRASTSGPRARGSSRPKRAATSEPRSRSGRVKR
jgi:hypothetical protein